MIVGTGADPLVEFEPVALGPFEIDHVPVAGVCLVLAFLLSLSLAARLARRCDVPTRIVLEAHVVSVPGALIGSRIPALLRHWPDVMRSPRGFLRVLAAEPSVPAATATLVGALAVLAWASRRSWWRVADVFVPGLLLAAAGLQLAGAAGLGQLPRPVGLPATAILAVAGGLAWRLAARGRSPGEALLVGAEAAATAVLLEALATGAPAAVAVTAVAALAGLIGAHVVVRVRRREPVDQRPAGRG